MSKLAPALFIVVGLVWLIIGATSEARRGVSVSVGAVFFILGIILLAKAKSRA